VHFATRAEEPLANRCSALCAEEERCSRGGKAAQDRRVSSGRAADFILADAADNEAPLRLVEPRRQHRPHPPATRGAHGLVVELEHHPVVACLGFPASGRSVEALEIGLRDRLEIRHDDARNAAGLEHAVAFTQQAQAVLGIEVLEHVRGIDGAEMAVRERQRLGEIVRAHCRRGWGCVKVDPVRMERRSAADVEQRAHAGLMAMRPV
jgi:hypothetical protein